MRDIEYRVYHKKERKMYYAGNFRMKFNRDHRWYILINPLRAPESPKIVEASEWIGFSDSKGKKVFVGDFVKVEFQTGEYMTFKEAKERGMVATGIYEVVWRNKDNLDGGYGGYYFKGEDSPHISWAKEGEIVGNIWENPGLNKI